MLLSELKAARVAVWGYGVEGQATCDYLQMRCPELAFCVLCPPAEVDDRTVQFITTAVDAALLNQFDVVIKSPGISPYQAFLSNAECQLISSAALWFANERSGQVIAITGTKGKSTSCAMLAEVLSVMGYRVVLAGNIGVPLIQCLDVYDFVVLETSSYQAQDGAIKADVAVLLNLYSEHLNWHHSEQQYHLDKWRLLQQASHAVLNGKDQHSAELLTSRPVDGAFSFFEDQQGYYELNEVLMYQDKALLSKYGWSLKGAHNLRNAAAVCTVIGVLGLDIKQAINAIKKFKALPHRLESVATIKGVSYINDSISSTPHATWAALTTVEIPRTILLVGGFDRGVDWLWWVKKMSAGAPKAVICSGQNGKKIAQLILNHGIKTQCLWEPSLKQAVQSAKQLAQPGDFVLLSPGAPSFDAFNDYQHRGQKFIQWIN